jgi:hypothetical protein
MAHRNYFARIAYLTHGVGETGREEISVSVQSDGSRTLRAQCEMDDFDLLRDVLQTVDQNWRPIDSYVRLTIGGVLSGAAWYLFDDCQAECHGFSGSSGPFKDVQTTEQPIQSFGSHSLQNDAWLIARVRSCGGDLDSLIGSSFTTSLSSNGGTGPALVRVPPGRLQIRDLGDEVVTVQAGRFDTHHIRVEVEGVDSFDIWAAGEDCLPVRLTSDGLGQTYELVELRGDVR